MWSFYKEIGNEQGKTPETSDIERFYGVFLQLSWCFSVFFAGSTTFIPNAANLRPLIWSWVGMVKREVEHFCVFVFFYFYFVNFNFKLN